MRVLCIFQSQLQTSCLDLSDESCLLSVLADAPPFTHLPLLPWFPYTQHFGVSHQDMERLQE